MDAAFIKDLLDLSFYVPVAALLLPLLVLVWNVIVKWIPGLRRLQITLSLTGYFISLLAGAGLALWGIHYAVLPFGGEEILHMSYWERIVGSLLKAAKVIGLDEDFDQLVKNSRMMIDAYGWSLPAATRQISGLAGTLYVLVPFLSGFGLVQILAGLFPSFRHWLLGWVWWKEKYYFSACNRASVTMAESIAQVKYGFWKKPVLVFAGVEGSDEKTKGSNAICLKKDLNRIKVPCWGKRKFFLMDEEAGTDEKVLQQFIGMTEGKICHRLRKAEVFLFVKTDAYVQVEKNLREKLEKQISKEDFPIILPVRCDFNLVGNLLTEVPLFEPLLGRDKQELTVSILGGGALAKEMFLTTYWIGQMLDCGLRIRVCDDASEEKFWEQIDQTNPEIRKTVTANDPVLQIGPQGGMAEPYAQVEYLQWDQRTTQMTQLTDTDYFFVALGADKENIAMADMLRRYVGEAHIARQDGSRTVITYVVRDQQLADTLNQKKQFAYAGQGTDVYMQAVGGSREVYSIRNVFMLNHDRYAQATFNAYEALHNKENREKQQADRRKEEYKYWASLARSMHLIYKIYAMGALKASLFESKTEEEILQARKAECQRGRGILLGRFPADFKPDAQAYINLLHRLAWLEHRRWNAFTRVKGYRSTRLYDTYGPLTGSHKQMELKLHPCLVECDQKGIRGKVTIEGKVEKDTQTKYQYREDYDYLDQLTFELNQKGLYNGDLKYYDYPFESVKEDA